MIKSISLTTIVTLITMWQQSPVIFANQIEPLNARTQNGNILAKSMIDSGSVYSLITKTLANRILKITHLARWIITKQDNDLNLFSNESIKVLGKLATTVTYNDWTCEEACLTVVEGGHKLVNWRDIFNSLGLAVVQQQVKRGKCANNIDNSSSTLKQTMGLQFPHLISRIGLSKTPIVKSNIRQKFTAKHQKGFRVPII